MRRVNRGLPNRLQFRKHFFAQMPALAPALRELVQLTRHSLPVWSMGVLYRPRLDLFNQCQALRLVSGCLRSRLFQPSIDYNMRTITSSIKSLPKCGVGCGFFVYFFPLLAQIAQSLLHLATAHCGHQFWLSRSWLLNGTFGCNTLCRLFCWTVLNGCFFNRRSNFFNGGNLKQSLRLLS